MATAFPQNSRNPPPGAPPPPVSPVAPSRLLAPGALARAPEEGADCRAVCAQRRWASISAEDEAHMGDHPSDYLCIVFSAGLTYFGER